MIHEKTDGGAVGAATNAVIKLLVGTHRERRAFLVVKGAQALKVAAGFSQRDRTTHDFDDVDACEEVINERLLDLAGH
jgi:hypothetical protein